MELDYDLSACLDYNDVGITKDEIQSVLAVWEGERDGDDWRWIVALNDGRFAFIQGGCDYTGWDCQSNAEAEFADSPESAALLATTAFSWSTGNDRVQADLERQLAEGKAQTWREQKDAEFGVVSGKRGDS